MNTLSKINHIPWKYVLGMNLSVLALAVTFASLQPVANTTDPRSQAKDAPNGASPTPLVTLDPNNLPILINPDITWAKIDDAVVIKGKNLVRTGTLFIGDREIPEANIISWESSQIVVTIPEGAITAPFTLKHELGSTSTKNALEIVKTNKAD